MTAIVAGVHVSPYRSHFPIFEDQQEKGIKLAYFDSAATTHKPREVIEAEYQFYAAHNANIHRGVYALSETSTRLYEEGREAVANFLSAPSSQSIVFTGGTTSAINMVAYGCERTLLQSGDEILVSALEHHANLVPWQQAALRTGATVKVIPLLDDGGIDLAAYKNLLSARTKMVALTHVSNVTGAILPIKKMVNMAHDVGALVLVDGAQAVAHMPVSVSDLCCDFYVFSSHKLYGPMGLGVLYGRLDLLNQFPPLCTGGGMIERVSWDAPATFAPVPAKFEAGTPPVSAVVGLTAALRYLLSLGFDAVQAHESALLSSLQEILRQRDHLQLLPSSSVCAGVLSFTMTHAHPHDIATLLDREGVAVRAGHHCAMPLMRYFGVSATARVSLGLYNQASDLEALVAGLDAVDRVFSRG